MLGVFAHLQAHVFLGDGAGDLIENAAIAWRRACDLSAGIVQYGPCAAADFFSNVDPGDQIGGGLNGVGHITGWRGGQVKRHHQFAVVDSITRDGCVARKLGKHSGGRRVARAASQGILDSIGYAVLIAVAGEAWSAQSDGPCRVG